ncbi:MAG: hypothetical protein IAE87_03590 [Rhodobacteraceae bacterium]|nr:hypothetical protein [Paracoccaceae bacterium]
MAVDLRWGFDLAFPVSTPLPDDTVLTPARPRFAALAEAFGRSAADHDRWFSTSRATFRLVGVGRCRPKYPISAERIPGGQGLKFTADRFALLPQKRMRDVTRWKGVGGESDVFRRSAASLFAPFRDCNRSCSSPQGRPAACNGNGDDSCSAFVRKMVQRA